MSLAADVVRQLAGSWSEKNSLFRVGENISEWLVMLLMFLVVLGVILFEQVWHWLGHKLQPYPKYHEMMHKITSELMILGMLGLIVHLLSEAYVIDYYSKPVKAFKIADQTIFFVAVALIVQALLIFQVMKQKNIMTDQIELVSSGYIYKKAKEALNKDNYANWFQYAAKKRRALKVMRHKLLRRFFLKTYKLPDMFQFSWYLRMNQDSQIEHLIEVELTQWMILLLVWCGFIACHKGIEKGLTQHADDEPPVYVRVYVFLVFELILSAAMLVMWLYIKKCMNAIYSHLGIYHNKDVLGKMRECAIEEHKYKEDHDQALKQLEQLHYDMDLHAHGHRFFLAADQGVQLLSLACGSCGSYAKKVVHIGHSDRHDEHAAHAEEGHHDAHDDHHGDHGGGHGHHEPQKTLSDLTPIRLPFFSRKLLHYVLKTCLMLNGLYVAMAMNSIGYLLDDVPDLDATVAFFLVFTPLVFNSFVIGPRVMLRFMTLSTVWTLNPDNVSQTVGQYLSTIENKTQMVESIKSFMAKKHKTINDLREDLEKNGGKKDYIDIETFRLVLAHYGFHVSIFRFNAMIRLVFKTKGTHVNYEQLLSLLEGDVNVCVDQTIDKLDESVRFSTDSYDFMEDENDGVTDKFRAMETVSVDLDSRPQLQPLQYTSSQGDEDFTTPSADGDLIHGDATYSEHKSNL
ncbi:unnamed protein product [Aphanomyces euteiches]